MNNFFGLTFWLPMYRDFRGKAIHIPPGIPLKFPITISTANHISLGSSILSDWRMKTVCFLKVASSVGVFPDCILVCLVGIHVFPFWQRHKFGGFYFHNDKQSPELKNIKMLNIFKIKQSLNLGSNFIHDNLMPISWIWIKTQFPSRYEKIQ